MVGAERAGRRRGRRRFVHRAIARAEADRKGAKPHPAGSRRGHDRGRIESAGKKRAHRYVSHQTRVDSVDYALAKLIRDFNLWARTRREAQLPEAFDPQAVTVANQQMARRQLADTAKDGARGRT